MTYPRYDAFLCYNSLEKDSVSWLEKKLIDEGLQIFLDNRILVAGDSLSSKISAAIVDSSSFVVLLGPSGISKFQNFEIEVAVQQEIENPATYRIIVLMLAGAKVGDLPASLRRLLRVDFSTGLDDLGKFRRLVDGIRGNLGEAHDSDDTSVALPSRSMAPRSEGFVQRPELEVVVRALTSELETEGDKVQRTVALTTALRGAGGFGKTALAQAVCEHPMVKASFPAGVLWTTLGQRLSEAQRLAKVRDLLRWWTRKEPPSYESLESAASILRENLSGHRVLLVLDDVWLAADVEPFAGIEAPAALLITTRNTRALPTSAYAVVVDALELPRAIELLGQGLSPLPPVSTLERLARRLGEWPILLKLVNAQLREEYRDGVVAHEAFRVVEGALDEMGLTAFDREDEEARNLAVRRTVEASLQRLFPEDRKRYAQLAVFPEDERIPLAVLELLWKTGEHEVIRTCRRLMEMSLLYRVAPVVRWIQLHDVMRAYLLREYRADMQPFQGNFVDSYLDLQRLEGVRQGVEPHQYFLMRLPYHLKESGREQDLENLLFSYPWLEKKIAGTDVNAAVADYRLLSGNRDAASVQEALLLSRSVLTKDPSQLASHLHGRLMESPSARITGLLEEAIVSHTEPWLRPLTASFRRPSDPLRYSFQAHQGEVLAIDQLDEHRFATTGAGGEVRVWDFGAGELVETIDGTGSPIRHLKAITPNLLLAASDDGVIRLWNLEEKQVIRSFEGHRSPITVLRVRGEEFISGAEDGTLLRWRLDSEQPLRHFEGHVSKINSAGYLDARTIVSVGYDRTLRVWNLLSGQQLRYLTLPLFAAEALEVTASNEVILGTFAGEIQTWKPLSREIRPRRSFRYNTVGVGTICMLGRHIGVSQVGGLSGIQLWDTVTGPLGTEIHVPGGGVNALTRFGADHLLCGSKNGGVSVWSVEALRAKSNEGSLGAIYAIAALDATTAVSTSADGPLYVWNVPDGAQLRLLKGHLGTVGCVCVLDAGRIASSSFADGTIRIWNPWMGELLNTIHCQQKPGALALFGSDLLLSAPINHLNRDEGMQIWDVVSGQKREQTRALPGGVGALRTVPGQFVVIGDYNGLVTYFDISASGNHRSFQLQGHERGVVSLALIGESRLASGSLDQTIRIWDISSQETIQLLRGHEGEVTGLVSISSRLLASASSDQTIKVWDLQTGRPVMNLYLDAGLSSLAVMPDGKILIAGDASGTVHFLRLEALTARS